VVKLVDTKDLKDNRYRS